jgi:hypothetical protein
MLCSLFKSVLQTLTGRGWIYEAFFAIETLLVVCTLNQPKVLWSKRKRAYILRNIAYLSAVVIYGVSIVIYIVVDDDWDLLGI